MAEKLTESTWTAFTKKQKLALDDAALVKALAKFDKTAADRHPARLDAADDVAEAIKKQVVALGKRKKELGDKAFGEVKDKLYGLLAAAEAERKATQATQASQASQAEAAATGADEEDSPALLTTKMAPLLRELRKGDVRMHALICTAGKDSAVLVMRHPVPTSRRKMLGQALGAAGGAKYIVADCLQEGDALTFVVQSPAAGLAKRLRQALFDQTKLRLKIRVRGDDGAEDEHGDEEGDEPDATAATTATAVAPAAAVASAAASSSPPARPIAPAIVYTQTRLAWIATRRKVQGELQKLEQAILDRYKDHPVLPALGQGVRKLDQVLAMFDESLVDKLDEALNATDPQAKRRLHDEARDIIARYDGFLKTDALVRELDANPFVPIAVQSTLTGTLSVLAAKIV